MEITNPGLAFEQPVFELEHQIQTLQQAAQSGEETHEEVRQLRLEHKRLLEKIYGGLSPWQSVQVARHKDRPYTRDYLSMVFDEWVELHGDRLFGDDRAMLTGFAKLDRHKVLVVGHQKGRTYKERTACYFGCAHPEGYRKAMQKMQLAAKFGLPVICFIDTPGAYPGIGAEERGQAWVIAKNMFEMSQLGTPIICVVIGEGGSGGALGIGVGNQVAILEHAYYSVISPEGCAGILWKSHEYAEHAANALRFTSKDLLKMGIVDEVIKEPLGGAHRDHHQMASRIKLYLNKTLKSLGELPQDELIQARYDKFRKMGVFLEEPSVETPSDVTAPSAGAASSS